MSIETQPLACNMLAIPAAEREEHTNNWQRLMAKVDSVQALPQGYAFQFQPDDAAIMLIAHVVARERLCCPFFNFRIELEPQGGPMWLKLTGREGVKQFIEMEFATVLAQFTQMD